MPKQIRVVSNSIGRAVTYYYSFTCYQKSDEQTNRNGYHVLVCPDCEILFNKRYSSLCCILNHKKML
jgi:hypothetical protein